MPALHGRRSSALARTLQSIQQREVLATVGAGHSHRQQAANERRQSVEQQQVSLNLLRAEYEAANANGFKRIYPTEKAKDGHRCARLGHV